MNKIILHFNLCLLIISCNSTKTYNESVNKTHSIENLKEDVDFLFKNLNKSFPRLYEYISEEELNQKIQSFKDSLTPMTSAQFYQKLFPLVSEVRQGHLFIKRPFTILERKERKRYKNAHNEFGDVDFKWIENSVYIEDTYRDIDSIIIGSKVLAVDSIPTEAIMDKWQKRISSDGYNSTFHLPIIADNLLSFYRYDVGRTDSINLKLKKADSTFTQQLRIVFEDEKTSKKNTDSLETQKQVKKTIKLSRAEKKLKRIERKKKKKDKLKRGYIASKKLDTRAFKLIGNDTNIAYLKIRGFSGGDRWSKRFYEETFKKINSLKIENLILDLRDNTGGSLKELRNLYGYLAKDEFRLINPIQTKTRFIITGFLWSGKPTFVGHITRGIITPLTVTFDLLKSKSKNKDKYYNLRFSKPRIPSSHMFKGDIYVLINGASYSASAILSSNLHGSERAVFVGEETGGAYNGTVAGLKMTKYLPNSQISVLVWMMQLETPYKQKPNGYGIKPDIKAKPKLEDFLDGRDTVLEIAINEIENL